MTYAVAMTTISNFEQALGRKIIWRTHSSKDKKGNDIETYVPRLRIYPHALREANAFYNPDEESVNVRLFYRDQPEPRHSPGRWNGFHLPIP